MPNKIKGGIKVPYRCAQGGEYKPLGMFSKTQQQKRLGGGRVNPGNSGMVCKEHSQAPTREHDCIGCNRRLPYDSFSLNQRKLEDWRCERCVGWDVTQEPSVVPIPKATGHISVEEEDKMNAGYIAPTETRQFFDEEEDDLPGAPITCPESLGLDSTNEATNKLFDEVVRGSSQQLRTCTTRTYASTTSSVAGDYMSTTSSRATLPPHLRDMMPESFANLSIDEDSISYASNVVLPQVTRGQKVLPPHLRGMNIVQQSTSSVTGSVSTATTVRKEQEEEAAAHKITFNAWDSKGQRHTVSKNPTVKSSSASEVSTADENDGGASIIDGWDDIPPMPEVQTRGGSKWPKSSEVKSRISTADLRKQTRASFRNNTMYHNANDRYFNQPNITDQAEITPGRQKSEHPSQFRNQNMFEALSN
ncbi:hypothetical protein FBEOM_3095 [Fusarium beomiforme]|uniref:Stc1 domain-containing protein n=1 Tax=Fusarium beomiforme TaxID=44412 RepID=A0A9P5AQD1_9HYPO|nr:hypothetical protein FBEOM_3095 [Fusarium beomiforme]